jgi:TP901 family phage tail tape measure protein
MAEEVESGILKLLIEAVDKVSEPLEGIHKSLEGTIDLFKRVAAAASEVLAGYEMLAHIIEPAAAMEEAQVGLLQTVAKSAENLEELRSQADQLSEAYGMSAEQVTAAQIRMARQTGDLTKSIEATALAAKLAAASGQDVSTSAQELATVYESAGNKAIPYREGLQDTADLLAVLDTKYLAAGQSASRMGMDFARIAGEAEKFHMDLDPLVAMLAEFSRLGVGGARGGGMIVTQLMEAMDKLDPKSGMSKWSELGLVTVQSLDGTRNALQSLQLAAEKQPEVLHKFLNSLGMTGTNAALLVTHLKDMPAVLDDIHNRAGMLDRQLSPALQTETIAMQDLRNSVSNLFATLGEQLLPILTPILHGLTYIVTTIREFLVAHPIIAQIVAGFVALAAIVLTISGIMGFLAALGPLFAVGLAAFGAALLPVTAVVAAIAALVGIIVYAWPEIVRLYHWGVEEVEYWVKKFHELHNSPIETLKYLWSDFTGWLRDTFNTLVDDGYGWLVQESTTFWKNLQTIYHAGGNLLHASLQVFGRLMGEFWTWFVNQFIIWIGQPAIDFWNALTDEFIQGKDAVLEVLASFAQYLKQKWDQVSATFAAALQAIGQEWDKFKGAIAPIFDWLGDQAQKLLHLLQPVLDALAKIGSIIPAWGNASPVIPAPGFGGSGALPLPGLPGPRIIVPRGDTPLFHPTSYNPDTGLRGTSSGAGGVTVNYSVTNNVQAGSRADADTIASAISASISNTVQDLREKIADLELNDRRTSFQAMSYST